MSSKDSPWADMGKSLMQEIDGDAPVVAKELFGDKWPGTATIPDTKAASMITDAYQRGDRAFLGHLATQGPQQFLRVWKSLGGTVPDLPAEMPGFVTPQPGGSPGPVTG